MGAECALASNLVTHNSAPVFESKARKRLSVVAPMKTKPPAVARLPPILGRPVLCFSGYSGNLVGERQEVEAAAMEIDSGNEVGFVAETASGVFDPLNL